MAKNLFNTKNLIDGMINIGVGGAANVAIDKIIDSIEMETPLEADTINLGKFVLGVVGSSMVSNKIVKAAMDGVATVGISNYVSTMLADTGTTTTAGLPNGMIGRPRYVPARKALAHSMRTQQIRGVQSLME